MRTKGARRQEAHWPSIVIKKWLNLNPNVHDFSEDEVDTETKSEDEGCDRAVLYDKRVPLFDEFKIKEEMNNILSKRKALVSIDVNWVHGMLGQGTSQEKAILEVNLAAAKQIARELRLRDIGGIIVIDFIDMEDEAHKRLVYEEVKKAVEKDRSMVKVFELSRHGLMEITRKRVPVTLNRKRTRLAILRSSLRVWILLKVARGFGRGAFEVKSPPDDDGSASNKPKYDKEELRAKIEK